MNGLGKPFRKNLIQKIEKTVKTRVKWPNVNKKPLARTQIFVQTPFSYSSLKVMRKKFTPQKHSHFRSTSSFGLTKTFTLIWIQKSWKCVNRSLKKYSAPTQIKFFEMQKTMKRPIIVPAIAVRLFIIKTTPWTKILFQSPFIRPYRNFS